MAMGRPDFRMGRIIGAWLRTKKGPRELHPAVIITPDAEIVQPSDFDPRTGGDNVVVVVGVSTKYKLYSEPFIELPFQSGGHPVTKLTRDCAMIVGWYDAICIPDDVHFWAGDVPANQMTRMNDAVRADLVKRLGKEFNTLAEILPLLFP